jgi:hypothetical protein
MARRTPAVAAATGILAIALWGCGAAATPIPSAAAPSVAASEATTSTAPSEAVASTEPSVESSGSGASFAIPSFAIPSLPSEAKDLEALLPDTLCGTKTTKLSMNGASFLSGAGNEFSGALSALGKSPSDVSVAVAGAAADCSAIVFRIAGVDQNALQSAILSTVQQATGTTATQTSLGGKSVYLVTDANGTKSYVYFKNDTIFIAETKTEADATTFMQGLP